MVWWYTPVWECWCRSAPAGEAGQEYMWREFGQPPSLRVEQTGELWCVQFFKSKLVVSVSCNI